MPEFSITTLGCKVNQCESAVIREHFTKSGWIYSDKPGESDVCVINTCTVTCKAAMQSRQAVRQAIRANPAARIVVTGCYAQTEIDTLQHIDGIHYIVGHGGKLQIPEIILSPDAPALSYPIIFGHELDKHTGFDPFSVHTFGDRTRPFLKIQDGCNAFCTYCIVPYARGRSRSMPVADAIRNLKRLHLAGFREVVLTGIHIGCYGLDLHPKTGLSNLLEKIDALETVERIRISSIEPNELTDGIIQLVAESDRICNHFHIPLQSGDDRILQKMKRPYNRFFFQSLISRIHRSIPDTAIGVDTLIGFPGETAEAFERTYDLIKGLPVAYLHVFPFSVRKGTPAAGYRNRVPDQEIKRRCEKMRLLGLEKRNAFYRKQVDKTLRVLVENTSDASTGISKGLSDNYVPVFFEGENRPQNTFVHATIRRFIPGKGVYGRVDN